MLQELDQEQPNSNGPADVADAYPVGCTVGSRHHGCGSPTTATQCVTEGNLMQQGTNSGKIVGEESVS